MNSLKASTNFINKMYKVQGKLKRLFEFHLLLTFHSDCRMRNLSWVKKIKKYSRIQRMNNEAIYNNYAQHIC